jgi:hypothetical protein
MSTHTRVNLSPSVATDRRRRRPVRGLMAVTVTALAAGFVSAGPAFTASAAAAPSVGSAFIASNTLTVTGTNGPDLVALGADATEVQVVFRNDTANVRRFNLTDFNAISVSLGNGDDQFTEQAGVLVDKALTVNGGNGNDAIKTGDGIDAVFGGNGDDSVDAGRGNDSAFLGNGNDFFVWNPGQGSDTVDGDNGNEDVLQFNGSNQNETMSLSTNGSAAVFLRDVAGIRMDMNDIEVFNLKALGGADNITVDDMDGTSVRRANIDLFGAAGGADQQTDVVTVNGTNRPDRVDVSAPDGQIDVAGLQTDTRISGSETLDRLQVDTLDGDDTVDVAPDVSTLIGVAVDLGVGQQ